MTHDNVSASTPDEQAELFNAYFQSVFFVNRGVDLYNMPDDHTPQISIENFDHSLETVADFFSKLDTTKSRGPDNLPPVLFRKVPELARSVSSLFYKIEHTGVYPRAWKVSKVTPIHKCDDRSILRNYRPVSLLRIPSKVLERCRFNALYPCVAPFLHSNQYGFRCKRSASLHLLAYLDGIYRGLKVSENSVCSLYLDLSKAFDMINHQLLLRHGKIIWVAQVLPL